MFKMFKSFDKDRPFIEWKYHKLDEPFDPYARRCFHGWDCPEETGLSLDAIKEGLLAVAEKYSAFSHPIRKARAVEYVLDNTRIDVNEHDYFPWIYTWSREIEKTTIRVWSDEVFTKIEPQIKEPYDLYNECGASAMWLDYDHVVPDWKSLMELGFPGILKRIKYYHGIHKKNGMSKEMKDHFDAMEIEWSAVVRFVRRLYEWSMTKTNDKSRVIQKAFLHLSKGAPQNTFDALMLIYLYFILSDSIDWYQVRSLGSGLDSTLRPFYEKDLKEKKFSRNEIKEFIAYFLMQWSAIGNIMGQPFYIGGTNPDGTHKYNDLSFDIIKTYHNLGIYDPKIQIKYRPDMPQDLLYTILDGIRHNRGAYVFCCESGMQKAVKSYGATEEEARDYDIRGCYETGVKANEVSTGSAYINALKAVEYVFNDGYDKRLKKQIGLKTGDVTTFVTFGQFHDAFLAQWDYIIDTSLEIMGVGEKYLNYINPSLLYSGTIEGALQKGIDAYQSGVKFNNSAVLNCGFGSAVDAMMAVKELIFDRKETTVKELKAALDSDWNGYEVLRRKAQTCKHKYGNDDEEADDYAVILSEHFLGKITGCKNARGGVYKPIMHSAMEFIWQGEKTLATPDGRKAGEEESKNADPSIGMDKHGMTALLNSVVKLKPSAYQESFCVDVMLHPSSVSGEEGLAAMKGLLDFYYRHDGMSIQFNIFNSETLRDAQKHPEKYRNLQVRICGWNVLWNNLTEKEQESYIKRAENIP